MRLEVLQWPLITLKKVIKAAAYDFILRIKSHQKSDSQLQGNRRSCIDTVVVLLCYVMLS